MDGHAIYLHRYAITMIFQWILRFLQKHNGPMERRTNRRMDIPSYRDAIAASKNRQNVKERISLCVFISVYGHGLSYAGPKKL